MKIDAHQHFWERDKVAYPWLIPAYGPIFADFKPSQLAPLLKEAGIDKTIIVQSADSYADTDYMLKVGRRYSWVGGVVGWVPLLDPKLTEKKLQHYTKNPLFKGIRHLIHEEKDPDWVVQPIVIDCLKILADFKMTFDVVAVFPNHLKHVPTLAEKVPKLKMVIDHLAKPPIKAKEMGEWAEQFARAAQYPNVYAKISGLNTAADWETWSAADIKPYIDFAIEKFGADRLMFGSDWPVAILAGDYAKVWRETNKALEGRSKKEIDAILGGTAAKFYNVK